MIAFDDRFHQVPVIVPGFEIGGVRNGEEIRFLRNGLITSYAQQKQRSYPPTQLYVIPGIIHQRVLHYNLSLPVTR